MGLGEGMLEKKEMIADEKKQEEKEHGDEFSASMKRFEDEAKEWRKQFA